MEVTLIQFQYGKTLPLSAVYLAGGLEKENIRFDLKLFSVDKFNKSRRNPQALFSFLDKAQSEIIAVGCFSDMLPYLLVALKKIKQQSPEKKIILGGIGPSIVAEEILEECEWVDFIIKGAGTSVLPRLIKKIAAQAVDFDDILAVLTKDNFGTRNAYFNDFYSDMPETLAYHCIRGIKSFDKFLIKTSSGCPYRCTFCYALPAAGNKIINRDLEDVIKEIMLIKKIRGRKFLLRIIDEAFVIDRSRVIKFCDLLREKRLNISWVCYGRVDKMDEELLRVMSKAGCREIYYGIESGSNRVLKKIKKGFSIEKAIKVTLLTKNIIPNVTVSFIYRFPFETLKDFSDTLTALQYLKLKNINTQLHCLTPVKNSEIYLRYRDNLRFSLEEPCEYLTGQSVSTMHKECIEFMSRHQRIFYDYGYYTSEDSGKINKLLKKAKLYLSPNRRSLWGA